MPVCQECKTTFKARATAKYCSDKCRKANKRKPDKSDKSDKKNDKNYRYPQPPDYLKLNGQAMEVWDRLREIMSELAIYQEADAAKIARYCCLEAEFRRDPEEYPSAKLAQLRLIERDLYLSPDTREALNKGEAVEENPFASLLKAKK